jgi:DNA modification methylase
VITKNEEEDLPRWLSCMQALADEIVVVDTGSTDKTVEIARQAGARVEYFTWIDDFAAAKNYAIDQTNGEWVLLLDADEYILPEDYAGLKTVIDRVDKDSSVIGLLSDWINVDKTKIHPTQKPVELLEYLIKTYSDEGNLILDNCMGSGSTAIACINTNRNYIGFENNKEYYDISIERIYKHKQNLE